MRTISLLFVLAVTASLHAGERPILGPETLLGDATLTKGFQNGSTSPHLATDGDSILMAWGNGGNLLVQLLTREGRLATALPTVLMPRLAGSTDGSVVRVLWLDGLYWVFGRSAGEFVVIRLSRDLEIIDVRKRSDLRLVFDVEVIGDEIFMLAGERKWRMTRDLEIVAEAPLRYASRSLVPSPHGMFLLTASDPAITAERFDGTGSVRIASVEKMGDARMAWTGTEFVVVWTDCSYDSCEAWMARFDETLSAKGEPVKIDGGGYQNRWVHLTVIGDDTVFVLAEGVTGGPYSYVDASLGRRYRQGVALESKPRIAGRSAVPILTSQGQLFVVDGNLNVSLVPPAGAPNDGQLLPVIASPRSAASETLGSVAMSANGIAVVRRRFVAGVYANSVSILDSDGKLLREMPLPSSEILLSSDGRDFYAVGHDYYGYSWFQKLEPGTPQIQLPFRALAPLAWSGGMFVTVAAYRTAEGDERTRLRWLDRNGQSLAPFCKGWEAPWSAEASLVEGGGQTYFMWYTRALQVRNGCAVGDVVEIPSANPRYIAWQDGVWAWFGTTPYPESELFFTFSADPMSFTGPRYPLRAGDCCNNARAIAPIAGRWLLLYTAWPTDGLAVVDESGAVVGIGEFTLDAAYSMAQLMPVARDRVLAVSERQVDEPPYFGTRRVVVTPITVETVFRRRGARP